MVNYDYSLKARGTGQTRLQCTPKLLEGMTYR
jgi:hypothetical protein